MDSFMNAFEVYDWQLTSKFIFCSLIIVFLFFDRRLSKFSDEILVSPFIIMLSIYLSISQNLIAIVFFIELALFLKEILYKVNVKRFESYYFQFVRLPLWVFVIYSHYVTFSTFELVSVPDKVSSSLTVLFFSLFLILSSILMGFLYRKNYALRSQSEKVTTISILFPAISFKLISILGSWSDLLLPLHKSYMYNSIVVVCIVSLVLSIRYLSVNKRDDLFLGFSSMVCISIFPMLIYINNAFWDGFTEVSFKIILLLSITHLFYLNSKKNQFSQVIILILTCQILGLSPQGRLTSYFGPYSYSNDQLLSFGTLLVCLFGITIILKSMVNSLSKEI